MKIRLDKLLVEQGYAASRERAQALILAGRVLVAEQKVDKPGTPTSSDAIIRLLGDDLKYVSRGGLKLERALDHWGDRGSRGWRAPTWALLPGVFTDCLLQRGARSVLAIDTGYGQIAQKLRDDPRVTLMERTNARLLQPASLPPEIALIAMDVSFISATLVLPAVLGALARDEPWQGTLILLIKPQFEAGRGNIGKGGIVRDPAARQFAIDRVLEATRALHARETEVIDSPIKGMEGNHEYLLRARF